MLTFKHMRRLPLPGAQSRVYRARWCGSSPTQDALVLGATRPGQLMAARFFEVLAAPSAFPTHARIMNNTSPLAKAWEPSCVEIGEANVVFYFETGDDDGLRGFQALAAQVSRGTLPGRTENRMREGFASWVCPRAEYLSMLGNKAALPPS